MTRKKKTPPFLSVFLAIYAKRSDSLFSQIKPDIFPEIFAFKLDFAGVGIAGGDGLPEVGCQGSDGHDPAAAGDDRSVGRALASPSRACHGIELLSGGYLFCHGKFFCGERVVEFGILSSNN